MSNRVLSNNDAPTALFTRPRCCRHYFHKGTFIIWCCVAPDCPEKEPSSEVRPLLRMLWWRSPEQITLNRSQNNYFFIFYPRWILQCAVERLLNLFVPVCAEMRQHKGGLGMIFQKCNKENFDEAFLSDNVNFFSEGKVFYYISVWCKLLQTGKWPKVSLVREMLLNTKMGSC